MNRLGILDHITDEELDEVMVRLCATDEYGGKVKLLTREDLIMSFSLLIIPTLMDIRYRQVVP